MARLGYYEIGVPGKRIKLLPKQTRSPLFPLRGVEYAKEYKSQLKGLGNIVLVKVKGHKVKEIGRRVL